MPSHTLLRTRDRRRAEEGDELPSEGELNATLTGRRTAGGPQSGGGLAHILFAEVTFVSRIYAASSSRNLVIARYWAEL